MGKMNFDDLKGVIMKNVNKLSLKLPPIESKEVTLAEDEVRVDSVNEKDSDADYYLDDAVEDDDASIIEEIDIGADEESTNKATWKRQKREKVYLDNMSLADGESFDFSVYRPLTMSNWFTTFMFMNVPVFGLLYLIFIALFSKQPLKKDFARAYLVYQLIFIGIAVVVVAIACYFGIEMLDNALKFMQEL